MVFLDTNVLVYAIDLRDARKQSIAAAERAGADMFLSEDLADGETYCGIKVSNPFKQVS